VIFHSKPKVHSGKSRDEGQHNLQHRRLRYEAGHGGMIRVRPKVTADGQLFYRSFAADGASKFIHFAETTCCQGIGLRGMHCI